MDEIECEASEEDDTTIEFVDSIDNEEVHCPIIVSTKTYIENIEEKEDVIYRLLHQSYKYKTGDKVLLSIVVNGQYEEPPFIKLLLDEYPDLFVVNYIKYDWGVVTSIVQALQFIKSENASCASDSPPYTPETRLIYCEDNVVYPESMVEILNLVNEVDSDCSIWGSTGFTIANMNRVIQMSHGSQVEVIESYGGVITRVGTFLPDFMDYIKTIKEGNNLVLRDSADIVISNYFSKHKYIKKIVNLSDKKYSFQNIWLNRKIYDEAIASTQCSSDVWEAYIDVIYVLAGWKELYLQMS